MFKNDSIIFFLRISLILALLFAFVNCTNSFLTSNYKIPEMTGANPLSIMQGRTTKNQTEIIILSKANENHTYSILQNKIKNKNIIHSSINLKIPSSSYKITALLISGLSLNKKYTLNIKDASSKTIDKREFSTLNIDKKNLTVAVASCMDYKYEKEQKLIWNSLVNKKPDIIFMIGDNAYPMKKEYIKGPNSPKSLWLSFVNTRIRLSIFHKPKLIPVLATWDDHDYGLNDGGSDFVHKKDSLRIHKAFFGPYGNYSSFSRGPGVSFSFIGFNTQFIFFDNRSFRSRPKSLNSTHWGKAQEKWAYKHLQSKKPTWFIQGDQFFGAYHNWESYERLHNSSFKKMLGRLSKSPSPVFFISGDRHLFELMKLKPTDLPYTTYEMTTSSIHSRVFTNSSNPANPRRVKEITGKNHFALVKLNSNGSRMKMNISVIGLNGKNLYSKDLIIQK